ncbi:DPBB-1 domain-containing protein [Mycena kentingensis (nom. inval.)]|nr:DPBB-1 domain-containing protein [Mycena kentingensis (nom. inval.)]
MNSASDPVVAVAAGHSTTSLNGRTAFATVTDRCGDCEGGADLDMSPVVFSQLADLNAGKIFGVQWDLL